MIRTPRAGHLLAVTMLLFLPAWGTLPTPGRAIDLGPPPRLPPPEDTLGGLFPLDDRQSAPREPDLTPFPEPADGAETEGWESLVPDEPEAIPDGTIIFQLPPEEEAEESVLRQRQRIEPHDGTRDYSSPDGDSVPRWVVPLSAAGVLFLLSVIGWAVWRTRRTTRGDGSPR